MFSEYELECLKQIDWYLLSYKLLRNIDISIVPKAEDVLGEIITKNKLSVKNRRLSTHFFCYEKKLMKLGCQQSTCSNSWRNLTCNLCICKCQSITPALSFQKPQIHLLGMKKYAERQLLCNHNTETQISKGSGRYSDT